MNHVGKQPCPELSAGKCYRHSLNLKARLPKVPTNLNQNSRRISLSSYDRYSKQVAPCKRSIPIIYTGYPKSSFL